MRLADFIESNVGEILANAVSFAETQAPRGVTFSADELRNHLPQILNAIVADLRSPQSASEQRDKSEGRAPARTGLESAATYHGRTRALAGFDINRMVAEYRALRAAVLRLWTEDAALANDAVNDIVRFNEAIDQAVAESLAEFSAEVDAWRQIFLGALGHDLRGPLTAVVFTAQSLVEKTRDTPYARQVERIRAGGERMHELLDALLAYSRSELGAGMAIEPAPCDLARKLGDEVELLRAAWPDAAIRYASSGPTQGRFDASRVCEALHHLVANAVKYGDGAISITVTGAPAQLRIAVANSGPPLSEDTLRTLFDPLRRGNTNAFRDEHVSLGLGLFLVREIVTAHEGSIDATSADGLTTFTIVLPRRD